MADSDSEAFESADEEIEDKKHKKGKSFVIVERSFQLKFDFSIL
jgi:hypothetical protein